jgi:hypothetical protein
MSQTVKLSETIIADARIMSHALNRSLSGQIEHWAKIGKIAEENPDLTYELIKNILIARVETKSFTLEKYNFNDE